MALLRHHQPSFVGGELSPQLAGRYDLARFSVGLAKARNMIVTPQGAVRTRPGFEWCGNVRQGGAGLYGYRLIPFIFSSEEACVLEFTDQTIRFWRDGALIYDGATPVTVSSPYLNADLQDLRYTQAGDIVTIVHPSYAPRELKRTSWTSWSLDVVSYAPRLTAPQAPSIVQANIINTDKREWEWMVTSVDSTTGEESNPSPKLTATVYLEATNVNSRCIIHWPEVQGITEYNVFRGRNSFYGFVGTSRRAASGGYVEFHDDNFAPVYGSPPPTGASPFDGANKYPSDCCYFEQRMIFARTNNRPQTLWASMSGAFKSFLRAEPPRDDDAIELTIAAARIDQIRAVLPLQSLLIFTGGSVHVLNPSADSPLTSDNAMPRPIGGPGIWAHLPPITAQDSALYVTSAGNTIRDVSYSWADEGYKGQDLTVLSRHLLDGYTIRDWAYAEAPTGVLWVIRSDGRLLGLSLQKEHDVWAWHRHDINPNLNMTSDDGPIPYDSYFAIAKACCVIPENGEDRLYVAATAAVSGASSAHMLRLYPMGTQRTDAVPFLDFSTRKTTTGTVYVRTARLDTRNDMGLGYVQEKLAGSTIDIVNSAGGFTGTVGKMFIMQGVESLLRVTITQVISTTRARGTLETDVPADLWGAVAERAGFGIESLSSLNLWANAKVSVVADGVYRGDLTVTSGGTLALPLAYRGLVVCLGFRFPQEVRTLDLQFTAQAPVVELGKLVHTATLACRRANDFWVREPYGPKYTALESLHAALVPHVDPASMKITLKVGASYTRTGALVVGCDSGEYFEINGIIREFAAGT